MTTAFGNGAVLCEVDAHGVVNIVLNRPDVNNAYNEDMLAGLHHAFESLTAIPDARVLVIRGNGRHFQAGADLAWISQVARKGVAENERVSRLTAEAIDRLDTLKIPTVALIQGACFGGGTGIAAACDIVVATDQAVFAITEARWGLTAGIILPQLCRAIGIRQVRRYALTCERFNADTALRMGFVHEVCPASELERVGAQIVDSLLMSAPRSIELTKKRALSLTDAFIDQTLLTELIHEHANMRLQSDAAEGTASFIEKRLPSWYKP